MSLSTPTYFDAIASYGSLIFYLLKLQNL